VGPDKILVDTSAWILSFKRTGDPRLKDFLRQSIIAGIVSTCSLIILELLQGCRTEEERDSLKSKLESLDSLSFAVSAWEQAYQLGFPLRRKGLTIPTTDLIIAALALENQCLLLHHDHHFEKIASCFPDLRTKCFKAKN
jgi:predicted nucleic acid-binding protein